MAPEAAGISPLARLKARREALVAEAESTLIPVPGWSEPSLDLRIHALPHSQLRAGADRIRKAKGGSAKATAELSAASATILAAIDAVVIGGDGGEIELPIDDPGLAEALGVDAGSSPLTILRAFSAGRDGTLFALAKRISEHSGYVEDETNEDWRGE